MLLTLAWLVRVDDRPEHRQWLKQLATDMQKCQDTSGGIREELGPIGNGGYRPPISNAEYGSREASAIQENGDPMADMLYTCNFAFLGLHEAYAVTGDRQYAQMADRLAEFFVRIQVQSESHPELDGGWFRAFDYDKWDYWGSNADAGWGAWSIEVGWTQAWIPTVLALRELDQNLWDLTAKSKIAAHYDKIRRQMLTEPRVKAPRPVRLKHLAIDKPVTVTSPPDGRYAGHGVASLTDGQLAAPDHTQRQWLGYEGDDLDATIDLGETADISELTARFLISTKVGIFGPKQVEFALSNDGADFQVVATIAPDPLRQATGPECRMISTGRLKERARYVRVRAENASPIPSWHAAKGRKAWLFIDEITVNPVKK